MNNSFIRTLWGHQSSWAKDTLLYKNRNSIEKEIEKALENKYLKRNFVVYVLGKGNYDFIKSFGLDVVMIDEEYLKFTHPKRSWLNKIYLLKHALRDFDKIIYLDWDTIAVSDIPSNIWKQLSKKQSFQAPLQKYIHLRIANRPKASDQKLVPLGACIYMADQTIPDILLNYESDSSLKNKWLDESYYAKYTDDIGGGWQGTENYWNNFEFEFCKASKGIFNSRKDHYCFVHDSTQRRKH